MSAIYTLKLLEEYPKHPVHNINVCNVTNVRLGWSRRSGLYGGGDIRQGVGR